MDSREEEMETTHTHKPDYVNFTFPNNVKVHTKCESCGKTIKWYEGKRTPNQFFSGKFEMGPHTWATKKEIWIRRSKRG